MPASGFVGAIEFAGSLLLRPGLLRPGLVHDGDRQAHDERRALALAGALGPHRAAVQLDQLLDDRQAQPQPAVAAGRRGVGLAEPLEDVRQELGPDAHAGVDDGDLDVRVDPLQEHLDAAPLGRELHGVGQQVPDDLLEPGRVARDRAGQRVEHLLEPDPLGLGGRASRRRSRPR